MSETIFPGITDMRKDLQASVLLYVLADLILIHDDLNQPAGSVSMHIYM